MGHTLVNPFVTSIRSDGSVKKRMLRDSFFNPRVFKEDGMDNLLRGMLRTLAAEVDNEITDEVRNFLVSSDSSRTLQLDLAALNIQRGRDHELPSINGLRSAFGLRPYSSFADLTDDRSLQERLTSVYGDISNVDPWVAGISEKHHTGSLGETFSTVWIDQFTSLRDGDRFYFERANLFSSDQRRKIGTLRELLGPGSVLGGTMRKVILRNSGIRPHELNNSPFFVQ